MEIEDVQKYLSNYYKGTKNPTLTAMKFFVEEFDHPEKTLKAIHIAGTNGKGSCVEIMTNILTKAGYKVGKFLSPHLIKYNERISIGNKNITDEEMKELIKTIHPKIEKYNKMSNIPITLFELETIMALLYFKNKRCDFVVLETGLGGKNDCTNIVNPIVSIINSISYDHIHILGKTLKEIAEQKAGIIKPNSNTVFIKQKEKEVNEIIEETCKKNNNKLHLIKKEDIKNYSYNSQYQKIDYKNYKNILINLKGKKQINNASLCIETIEILKEKGYKISEEAIKKALKTVVHKARFEIIKKDPLIIYDGAHNKKAIKNFKHSVDMYYKKENKVYIVSILKTKDYDSMVKELMKDKNSIFIFTDGNNKDKYVAKEELLRCSKKYTTNKNLYTYELNEAIELIMKKYKTHVTFIVGSFYIYETILEKIKEKNHE